MLESVQRRWTRSVEATQGMDYGARLKSLGLFSIKGRLLRADLIKYWKVLCSGDPDVGLSGLFRLSPVLNTRGHRYKLMMPACNTEIKKRSFNFRCIQLWNSLPEWVVEVDSLVSFKRQLSDHLGDVLYEPA